VGKGVAFVAGKSRRRSEPLIEGIFLIAECGVEGRDNEELCAISSLQKKLKVKGALGRSDVRDNGGETGVNLRRESVYVRGRLTVT
jgi:hypothetical protein